MIKLNSVFSSNAIFQHSSRIILRGHTDSENEITAILKNSNGETINISDGVKANDGIFDAEIKTPAASFEKYTITVSDGSEETSITDIMFGELWLASGQSNMELPNRSIIGCADMVEKAKKQNVRYYFQDLNCSPDYAIPFEPSDGREGRWIDATDDSVKEITAAGTAFASELYDILNKSGENIPVGIVNANLSATNISCWTPRKVQENDEFILNWLKETSQYRTRETWLTNGEGHVFQHSAMYNSKIYPLIGIKFKGIIWYQGEAETFEFACSRVYEKLLRAYYDYYNEEFSSDGNLKMIPVLLYPWIYDGNFNCRMNTLNTDFVKMMLDKPNDFAPVPIADLPPVWGIKTRPIHPTHKFAVGTRMAHITAGTVYGIGEQKRAAYPENVTPVGDRIVIEFSDVGSGLRVNGNRAKTLYIAGEDELYLTAKYEILAPNKLSVYNEYIKNPVSVAYAFGSFEIGCNLYAGEYPVIPFCTDGEKIITDKNPRVPAMPWLFPDEDSVWTYRVRTEEGDEVLDLFMHPVWRPNRGSELCRDRAFTLSDCSLRICAEDTDGDGRPDEYGIYTVPANSANCLELYRFDTLTFDAFCAHRLSSSLVLHTAKAEIRIFAEKNRDIDIGWAEYSFDLSSVPSEEITKLELVFSNPNSRYKAVNIENLRLKPRNNIQ